MGKDQWDSIVSVYQSSERALFHLADKHTITYLLEALPLAEGTEARVFYNFRTDAVYGLVDSLPELDPNEAYVLWSFDADDNPSRLGGINMKQRDRPQPFGTVADPAIFVISRETLPIPNAPSPERIQCAVRVKEQRNGELK